MACPYIQFYQIFSKHYTNTKREGIWSVIKIIFGADKVLDLVLVLFKAAFIPQIKSKKI